MYSLNNVESYSRISALGPVGHCTSHFKRAVCISCRPCVDVHKVGGGPGHVDACGQGEGVKNVIFCGRHKWMAPNLARVVCSKSLLILLQHCKGVMVLGISNIHPDNTSGRYPLDNILNFSGQLPWTFQLSGYVTSRSRCHEIEYPLELAYPGDTPFLSPSLPHLVKSQPMNKKLQA